MILQKNLYILSEYSVKVQNVFSERYTMLVKDILTKEFLYEKLIVQSLAIMKLAVEVGCCKQIIINYCKKHQIYEEVKQNRCISNEITENLIGKIYGKLTVIEKGPNDKHQKTRWICECECGARKLINSGSLKRNLSTSCGGCERKNFTGYKDISGAFWRRTKETAGKRGMEFEITPEYVWELYELQNRKCSLSGVEIHFYKNQDKGILQTASIDRIDSSKGYIVGNIQIIHKRLNRIKSIVNNEELFTWVRLINEYNIDNVKSSNIDVVNKNWEDR